MYPETHDEIHDETHGDANETETGTELAGAEAPPATQAETIPAPTEAARSERAAELAHAPAASVQRAAPRVTPTIPPVGPGGTSFRAPSTTRTIATAGKAPSKGRKTTVWTNGKKIGR